MGTAVAPKKKAPSAFEKPSPWSQIESLEERVDRMLSRLPEKRRTPSSGSPPSFRGVAEKDVKVDVADGFLTIHGEKNTERTEERKEGKGKGKGKKGRWHL
jgi:hypothetical protein